MSISLKKLWSDYGIGAIIVLLILAYGVSLFAKYVTNKGSYGSEMMNSQPNSAYRNKVSNSPNGSISNVQPSDPLGEYEVFASVQGIPSPSTGIPTSCSKQNIQNPSDLLPKDKVVGDALKEVHEALNLLLIGILIVHVLAALKHHFIDKDDVLKQMLPSRRQVAPEEINQ